MPQRFRSASGLWVKDMGSLDTDIVKIVSEKGWSWFERKPESISLSTPGLLFGQSPCVTCNTLIHQMLKTQRLKDIRRA